MALTVAAVLAVSPVALAAPRSPALVVSGSGGQTAVLTVPRGGLDVLYPVFTEPRVPGPDGTVGGVVIQRVGDGRLVGGLLLQNAPGFERAMPIPLVDFDHTVLPAGRYRLTLLGSGRQTVHLPVRRTTKVRHLLARGTGRPITRVLTSTSAIASRWSDAIGRITARDYVVIGAGSAGEFQQASENHLCLQPQEATGPCLVSGGFTVTPGDGAAGTWAGYLFRAGSLAPGAYVFSGDAVGVGPESTTAHAGVVISLPR